MLGSVLDVCRGVSQRTPSLRTQHCAFEGVLGITSLVSVVPLSPELLVNVDLFCFFVPCCFVLVACKKWNSNRVLPLNKWRRGGHEQ